MVKTPHISPLAEKFKEYKPASENANFAVFKQNKRRKSILTFWLVIVALVSLTAIFQWTSFEFDQTQTNHLSINPDNHLTEGIENSTKPVLDTSVVSTETKEKSGIKNKRKTKGKEQMVVASGLNYTEPASVYKKNENKASLASPLTRKYWIVPSLRSKGKVHFKPTIKSDFISTQVLCPEEKENTVTIPVPFSKKKTRKPFFTISIGPNLANNRLILDVDASDFIHTDYESIFNQTQRQAIGFQFNSAMHIPLSHRWAISAGLGFTNNKLAGSYAFQLDSVPIYDIDNTIAGYYVYPEGATERNVNLGSASKAYNFVRIPLRLEYIFDHKDLSFQFGLGTELAYLLSAKGRVLDSENLQQTLQLKQVINPQYMAFEGNATVFKKLNRFLETGLSFGYSQQLNSLYNQDHLKVRNQIFDIRFVTKFNL